MDTSNRFRVVRDVVCDDFMHLWRPLGQAGFQATPLAPRGAFPRSRMVIKQRGVSSVIQLEPGIQSGTFFAVGFWDFVTGATDGSLASLLDVRAHEFGCSRKGAARREGSCLAPRGLHRYIKPSYTTSRMTLKRLEVSTIVLAPSKYFWRPLVTPVTFQATE